MALLTGPKASRRNAQIARILLRGDIFIGWLLFASGVAWFLMLGSPYLNNATYFSENALLPGLVHSDMRSDVAQHAQRLATELQHERAEAHRTDTPHVWLQAKMRQIGLETYTHNFTLDFPLGAGRRFEGRNVYGILRAPRIGATESIVLSAPYRAANSPLPSVASSVPLLLAYAAHARKQLYWSKDLIFVITENEQLGMQAWLQAYYDTEESRQGSILRAGSLEARAGSIQAAINLELPSFDCSYLDVKIRGLNGQLPNLDLVNVVQRIALKEGIVAGHQQANRQRQSGARSTHWQNERHLFAMVREQMTGVPDGNHGLFHQYGIAALTVEGHREPGAEAPSAQRDAVGCASLLRLVEGTARSVNNLMERFHQSFFFYLLVASDRYVSIGDYFPSLVLMVASLLVKSLIVYMRINRAHTDAEPNVADATEARYNVLAVGRTWLLAHALGWLIAYAPTMAEVNGWAHATLGWPTERIVFGVLGAMCLLALASPLLMRLDYVERQVLHMVALIELATVLLIVGMLNFSLAYVLAAMVLPAFMSPQIAVRSVNMIFWLLLHPVSMVFWVLNAYVLFNYTELGFGAVVLRASSAMPDVVTLAVTDSMIYGNWVYNVVVQIMLPIWLIMWSVVCYSDENVPATCKRANKNPATIASQ